MKYTVKQLALALSLIASGAAHAAINPDVITVEPGSSIVVQDPMGTGRMAELPLLDGSVTSVFSNGGIGSDGLLANGNRPTSIGGLVGALNTGKVSMVGIDGATILSGALPTDTNVTLPPNRKRRGLVSTTATVTGVTINGRTGDILTVASQGGVRYEAAFIDGTLNGGHLSVSNLRFDLQNRVVIADMIARPMVGGAVTENGDTVQGVLSDPVEFTDVALWNIGTISGPTTLPPEGLLAAASGDFSMLAQQGYRLTQTPPSTNPSWDSVYQIEATNVFGDLTVTEEGMAIFTGGLGMVGAPGDVYNTIGYDALAGVNTKAGGWGSITTNLVYGSIPEPSTYVLMGLGLVGIVLVARRRPA